jgi:Methyltransferase domain
MIDMSIPGQMTEGELRGIEALARSAPQNACIVETGSLFGLSSFTWATSAPQDSTVYCIDPWVRERWIISLVEEKITNCPTFSRAAFEHFTARCKNIKPLQGYSPKDFADWNIPVDIFFDDAMHHNPYFRRNLRFWLSFMKPNSVMCGHDYCREWPDVISEVDQLAAELNSKVFTRQWLWWLKIPEHFSSTNHHTGQKWWHKILQP